MAVLYISEFSSLAKLADIQVAMMPPLAQQTVAIGVEAKSSAFGANTRFARVHCDAACSIVIGQSPTATTAALRLAADHTEYFGVQPGHRLSVIANT